MGEGRARIGARRWIGASLLVLTLALQAADATAQQAQANFSIPEQKLQDALLAYGQQAGVSITMPDDALLYRRSRAVQGARTQSDALAALLAGSGLTFEFVSPNAVRVFVPEKRSEAPRQAPRPAVAAPVQAQDEITVVASRLGTQQSAQPTVAITRKDIESSGRESVAQLLNNLPQVSVRSTPSPSQNSRGVSSVNLRGLPNGLTLVLLDGRKLGGTAYQSSTGITNLNLLPLAAIERIEVLPGGSSAVYGGDALAGVVNIVLRKNVEGGAVDFRYGGADNFAERQWTAAWGHGFDRGSISILAQHNSNNELTNAARDISKNTDFRRFGGPLYTTTFTSPGNVYSVDGKPLPGLKSNVAAIPAGNGVGLKISDFLATDGKPNTSTTYYENVAQVPPAEQYGTMVYGTFELTPDVELYGNVFYSHRKSPERDYTYQLGGQAGYHIVPANNPFNPFGVPVGVNLVFDGTGTQCYCLTQDYTRGLVGARGDIGSWHWDVAVTRSYSHDVNDEDGLYSPAATAQAGLSDTNPATALNPFQTKVWSMADIGKYNQHLIQTSENWLTTVDATVRGPLFELPAGTVRALAGVEYDYSQVGYHYYTLNVNGDRNVGSAFTEIRVPLLGPGEAGGAERVVLSGAARYDRFSDFGSKVSPQGGIEIRPVDGLLLRGSYSEAFKPPTLYQLHAPEITGSTVQIVDPRRGESYFAGQTTGGNSRLQPLTGESQSFGFVLTPRALPGLEISASKWRMKLDNYVSTIASQTLVNNESLFGDYVIRAAPSAADVAAGRPGQIRTVRNVSLNFGTYNIAGVDLAVRWPFKTSIGEFVPAAAATSVYRYNAALIPGAPVGQRAGKATTGGYAPKWKGQASLGWNTDYVETSFSANYTGAYRDYAPSNISLGNFWTFDLNARIAIGQAFRDLPSQLKGTYLTVGVRNLSDRLPDYSSYSVTSGYDPTQYDIIGRYLYAQVGFRF